MCGSNNTHRHAIDQSIKSGKRGDLLIILQNLTLPSMMVLTINSQPNYCYATAKYVSTNVSASQHNVICESRSENENVDGKSKESYLI